MQHDSPVAHVEELWHVLEVAGGVVVVRLEHRDISFEAEHHLCSGKVESNTQSLMPPFGCVL